MPSIISNSQKFGNESIEVIALDATVPAGMNISNMHLGSSDFYAHATNTEDVYAFPSHINTLRIQDLDRPRSAPVSPGMLTASSNAASPETPRPLTAAQKAALASIDDSRRSSIYSSTAGSPNGSTSAEMRRQLHIQCEQKRRAQIKNGFEEIKMELPGCAHKKLSKAMILSRALDYVRKLKAENMFYVQECERMRMEMQQMHGFYQPQMPSSNSDHVSS
jgi:hypothetical protein